MLHSFWQPTTEISTVIFDCDGTLTSIEGIDELARENGVAESVKLLTAEAMGRVGINYELYEQRLHLVQPTSSQVNALGDLYFLHRVPDIEEVIALLQRLNKKIYVISAGLTPAVTAFAKALHIPSDCVTAVDIEFDQNGKYITFDRASPLVNCEGKREVITHILQNHSTSAFIGDGLNDVAAQDLVTRFIGYGGNYYRENIESRCRFYICSHSLAAVLPLVLTQKEFQTLSTEDKKLFHKGLLSIEKDEVVFHE